MVLYLSNIESKRDPHSNRKCKLRKQKLSPETFFFVFLFFHLDLQDIILSLFIATKNSFEDLAFFGSSLKTRIKMSQNLNEKFTANDIKNPTVILLQNFQNVLKLSKCFKTVKMFPNCQTASEFLNC